MIDINFDDLFIEDLKNSIGLEKERNDFKTKEQVELLNSK